MSCQRLARERAVDVELLQRAPFVGDRGAGKNRQPRDQRLGLGACVRLDDADHDVAALIAQRAGPGEHRIGLADTRRRTEVDAQAAAPGGRLARLDVG